MFTPIRMGTIHIGIMDTTVGLGSSTGGGSKIREAKRRWNNGEWGPQSLTPPLPNSEGAVPDIMKAVKTRRAQRPGKPPRDVKMVMEVFIDPSLDLPGWRRRVRNRSVGLTLSLSMQILPDKAIFRQKPENFTLGVASYHCKHWTCICSPQLNGYKSPTCRRSATARWRIVSFMPLIFADPRRKQDVVLLSSHFNFALRQLVKLGNVFAQPVMGVQVEQGSDE